MWCRVNPSPNRERLKISTGWKSCLFQKCWQIFFKMEREAWFVTNAGCDGGVRMGRWTLLSFLLCIFFLWACVIWWGGIKFILDACGREVQDWGKTTGIGSLPFIYSATNPSRPEPRCRRAGDSLGAAGAGDGKEAGTHWSSLGGSINWYSWVGLWGAVSCSWKCILFIFGAKI